MQMESYLEARTLQKFRKVFLKNLSKCTARVQLFDQKYSKTVIVWIII